MDHVVLCGDVAGPSTDRDSDPWGPGARVRIWALLIGDDVGSGSLGFCLPPGEEKSVDFAGEIVRLADLWGRVRLWMRKKSARGVGLRVKT